MKSIVRRASLLLLLAGGEILSIGCQSQRERYVVDAFSAEARLLEDNIYALQHRVERLERQVARQRESEPASSRPAASGAAPAAPAPRRTPPASPPTRPRGLDLDEIPDLTPPRIDPGSPVPADDLGQSDGRPAVTPVTQSTPQAARRPVQRIAAETSDRHVAGLEFDAFLLSNAPSDGSRVSGLELLLWPVNDRRELVPVPGEVTVVVLDATDGRHIGRWEYDAATARASLQTQGSEPGILLELRWREALRQPQLHVFVRLEFPDGRRFETDRPFAVLHNEPAGQPQPGQPQPAATAPAPQVAEAPAMEAMGKPPREEARSAAAPRAGAAAEQGPPAAVYR